MRQDTSAPVRDQSPPPRRPRPLAERRFITRELRVVEGGETVTVSVVETETPRSGWRTRSRVITIYAVPWAVFARDPDGALRTALHGLIGPLLEDRAVEGEGLPE